MTHSAATSSDPLDILEAWYEEVRLRIPKEVSVKFQRSEPAGVWVTGAQIVFIVGPVMAALQVASYTNGNPYAIISYTYQRGREVLGGIREVEVATADELKARLSEYTTEFVHSLT